MQHLISIAIGGAVGALGRYWISSIFNTATYRIPYGTLICNIFGSFLMGVCFVLILEKSKLDPEMRPLLMIGFLGAFTTFSTFSLETAALLHEGHLVSAIIYALSSMLLCLLALYVGLWLTRLF